MMTKHNNIGKFNMIFDTLEDLIMSVVKRYPRMYKIENLDMSLVHVYEIDEFPDGMSLNEFVDFASKNEIDINKK